MNEIQDGGIGSQLVRRLNIVDTAAPAASLAPEIFPVYQVAPPSAEDNWLRGVILAAGSGYQGDVVAEYTRFRLANLPNSETIIIVDRFDIQALIQGEVVAGVTPYTTLLATVQKSTVRDTRKVLNGQTRETYGVYTSDNDITPPLGALGATTWRGLTQAGYIPQTVQVEAVITPGNSFEIVTANTAMALWTNIYWRERRAQPSELG